MRHVQTMTCDVKRFGQRQEPMISPPFPNLPDPLMEMDYTSRVSSKVWTREVLTPLLHCLQVDL